MLQIQFMTAVGDEWLLAREVSNEQEARQVHLSDARAVVIVTPMGGVRKVLQGRYTDDMPSPVWLPRASARMPTTRKAVQEPGFGHVGFILQRGLGESYDYDRRVRRTAATEWSWKPVSGPPGTGYVTSNGRAVLHKKGRNWFLTLNGKDHPINSRKPGFGHAETILQRELGRGYDRH